MNNLLSGIITRINYCEALARTKHTALICNPNAMPANIHHILPNKTIPLTLNQNNFMKKLFSKTGMFAIVFMMANLFFVSNVFGQTVPVSGDIVFTEFQTDDDVVEFLTLTRLDLRNVSVTDNGILSTNAMRSGEGTFVFANTSTWADIPTGTFIRLSKATGTDDTDPIDGIITIFGNGSNIANATGFDLANAGDQVIIYTGTTAAPSFIAGINGGDNTVWNTGATTANNSKAPGTTSDIDLNVSGNDDNGKYNASVAAGNASAIRTSCITTTNWTESNSAITPLLNLKDILFNESNFSSGTMTLDRKSVV